MTDGQPRETPMVSDGTHSARRLHARWTPNKVDSDGGESMKKMILLAVMFVAPVAGAKGNTTWSVKADYIEACSCHLFCPCYFNTGPEGGHHCEFNNAVKIAEGHVGDVKVDGAKFWLSGDLGGDWAKGMQGAVLTFDPAVTPEQQKAIQFLVGKIYPVKWGKVEVDKAPITWEVKGMDAHAKLGD